MFTRPTFSVLFVSLKDKKEVFDLPNAVSMGFRGVVNHPARIALTNTMKQFPDIKSKSEFHITKDWHGPASVGSTAHKEFMSTMHNNIISLCPRGSGIDSARLLETCYFTRVPVLISDHDYYVPGEDHYDTSFFYRICHESLFHPSRFAELPGPAEIYLRDELLKIYNTDIAELHRRAELARKYFENVIQKYFEDPTLYFLEWLNKKLEWLNKKNA
jgi:hypothetical protein